MDLNIPDEIWNRIQSEARVNLMCPQCIVERIEKSYGYSSFDLKETP
jgi:hypothetical protein